MRNFKQNSNNFIWLNLEQVIVGAAYNIQTRNYVWTETMTNVSDFRLCYKPDCSWISNIAQYSVLAYEIFFQKLDSKYNWIRFNKNTMITFM